jgi:hypothetical protein
VLADQEADDMWPTSEFGMICHLGFWIPTKYTPPPLPSAPSLELETTELFHSVQLCSSNESATGPGEWIRGDIQGTYSKPESRETVRYLIVIPSLYLSLGVLRHCMHVAPPILAKFDVNSELDAQIEVQSAVIAPPHVLNTCEACCVQEGQTGGT